MALREAAAPRPRTDERSPAQRALAIPLVAEHVAHFVLLLQPSPEELARMERGLCGLLRAALTPHWAALCRALAPGVLAFRAYAHSKPPYRQLYWQLRALAEPRPLVQHVAYAFVADVTFRSGEHVSTWSAAFIWPPPKDTCRDCDGPPEASAYTLPTARQARPRGFRFSAGDLIHKYVPDDPAENVTATLHVLRNDGAVARLAADLPPRRPRLYPPIASPYCCHVDFNLTAQLALRMRGACVMREAAEEFRAPSKGPFVSLLLSTQFHHCEGGLAPLIVPLNGHVAPVDAQALLCSDWNFAHDRPSPFLQMSLHVTPEMAAQNLAAMLWKHTA